jgi:hypothetical protein
MKTTAGDEKENSGGDRLTVKSIQLDTNSIDLNGFVFPSDAGFGHASFSGGASFHSATFFGNAGFGYTNFSGEASFHSAIFSSNASFEGATFSRNAWFDCATFTCRASFTGSRFSSDASFHSATFNGSTLFTGSPLTGDAGFTTFSGDAGFTSATFNGSVSFASTTLSGNTRFDDATFTGTAWFQSATFSGTAWFKNATFTGNAVFASATFTRNARYESATFKNSTNFGKAKFLEGTHFTGIKVERAFDMTGAAFAQVPAFNQADLKQAPDLDDVRFPLPGFWRGGREFPSGDERWLRGLRGEDEDLGGPVAKYRALRRMAIQGADYEREQMAYKGELRARRWTVDKWWSAGTWIGLFYDAFADCGRSIVRPANAWLASILLFAAFYWQRAVAGAGPRCEEAGGAALQALFLSVKNALVIFGGTRDARVNQAYLCLYNGSAEQPHIPPTVTFVETLAQIPVSATLIFLFLLAVKNRFKIK